MKKPVLRPVERPCPACNGTGMAPTIPPARPGIRIYDRCKNAVGREESQTKVSADNARPGSSPGQTQHHGHEDGGFNRCQSPSSWQHCG
jgi:hypothetical protein